LPPISPLGIAYAHLVGMELTDTPDLATPYCPRCDPERDPIREILTIRWCNAHAPTCEGADDERLSDTLGITPAYAEASAATNRPWCELVHRPADARAPAHRTTSASLS
jgi:hypothetical protein